ncbi:hypothetical protein HHL28_03990 [Aerophototrophica crusticola]|uniref:Uncharacterized protein n=1 Tax=Aerophototrophica crusticola TaxID=1709002 RepID=A0A858R4I4_9PROT|nr:hypothetical protein HHL28_03990 [Rhodospirillaceae bacterium B3]
MSEQPVPGLRELAVKIATSYTRANPTSVDSLPGIIQSAYRGLLACTLPPAAPTTAKSIRGPRTASARVAAAGPDPPPHLTA